MSDVMESLWGEEFDIPKPAGPAKTAKIMQKIAKAKTTTPASSSKIIKSKKVSIQEKLEVIQQEVLRVLGKQEHNITVIKTREDFHEYISNCIHFGRIDIDTETNNSLDPITCKLMGPCIYCPGQKQAYIPINHRNPETKERLPWQLTEKDVKEEFERLIVAKTPIIMHNGKFDYKVIKCTCNVMLPIYWDTMIGAKLLDENERSAGLKQQYIEKIDPEQEKYAIDELFNGVEYADVDPDIFAYYAATDALMTDKLYEWQKNKFENSSLSRVYELFRTIEMPLVTVLAEMELAGMSVDQEYAQLLSKKFHSRLDDIDNKIRLEFVNLKPQIDAWRMSPEANFHPKKKTGTGEGKSKNEQLEDPINLGSPTQLAILFYDILKCPAVSKKSPRGTGEYELTAIAERLNLPVCNLLLQRREVVKLLSTYVDVIPELAKRWPDGRVRTHFNQYGAATGRLSSSDPINFQNIPSHEKTIRMLFCSPPKYYEVWENDNEFIIPESDEVEIDLNTYLPVTEVAPGMTILLEGEKIPVKQVYHIDKEVKIIV